MFIFTNKFLCIYFWIKKNRFKQNAMHKSRLPLRVIQSCNQLHEFQLTDATIKFQYCMATHRDFVRLNNFWSL